MEPDDIRSLVHRYCAAWASRDRAGWLSTFADDAVQEDPVGDEVRRGHEAIGQFWDRAIGSYDQIDIRQRALHVVGTEAALEWTIVAKDGNEWVAFDGVDVFTFDSAARITSVRAYWERDGRRRTTAPP